MEIGKQIVKEFPENSPSPHIAPVELQSLQDLLEMINSCETARSQQLRMLRSTGAHLSQYLGRPLASIDLCTLPEAINGFKAYLKGRRLARNSIRSYIYQYQLLLRKARDFGWKPDPTEIENEWDTIMRCAKMWKCSKVVKYAIRQGLRPAQFSDGDLDAAIQTMFRDGLAYLSARALKRRFLKCISESGLANLFPRLSPFTPMTRTSIPLSEFPSDLRIEVSKLLDWKTKPYVDDRPKGGRLREISAQNLERYICCIYWYALNIKGRRPNTLVELFEKEILGDYLEWSVVERKVKLTSLVPRLATIKAIVRSYPPLANRGLDWTSKRLSQIREQIEEQGVEFEAVKKAQNSIQYEDLATIHRMLEKEIKELGDHNPRKKAILARDSLLILWLKVLPWRQRNIRELTLEGQGETTKLFKSEISPYSTVPRAQWVKDVLKLNPHAEFWQVTAYPAGNKTRRRVHMILPRQLVSPLEEYLAVARPLLTQDHDPGTLFVNDSGQPYSSSHMYERVAGITFRFTGKRVNPHQVRHIHAFHWLKKHTGDYLTVQKLLWHNKLETTIGIYGRDFDEAYAVCRVEEYLDEQEKVAKGD